MSPEVAQIGHAITGVSIVEYACGRRFVLAEVGIIATRP